MRKDGYWSGWESYRHGVTTRHKYRPIYKGKKREHLVWKVMSLMRDWRTSPFEYEASTRYALRQALIAKGHGWISSDDEAAHLVAEALHFIGAVRPTWDQGQRQYCVPHENCNWCAQPLPDEMISGNRKGRFCSANCAQMALNYRDYETRWKESEVGRSAYHIIVRGSLPQKECEYCQRSFQPFNADTRSQRYCSYMCSRLALRTIPEKSCSTCSKLFRPRVADREYCSYECAMERSIESRECAFCKRDFIPKTEQGIYCSKSCTMRSHRMRKAQASGQVHRVAGTLIPRTCVACGAGFDALSPKAQYCSTACHSVVSNVKRGRIPNRISPPFFDYFFKMAA